jgi:phosphopantothenoylcysteine decarboxylase
MESVPSDANDVTNWEKLPEIPETKAAVLETPPATGWEARINNRKPRIILAASGSVAAIKFGILADSLSDWAEVRAVATKPSLHFIDKKGLPASVKLYTDEDEWSSWSRIGDNVLHIELRKWADAMLIAPLSANTLAKVAGGLCDNLLTCIVRAWDFSKPMFVAPAMNTFMWTSPFTLRHLTALEDLGVVVIPPISKKLACGDTGNGAMAEPATIDAAMRLSALITDPVLQSLPAPPRGI